jgi:hypothetical protein
MDMLAAFFISERQLRRFHLRSPGENSKHLVKPSMGFLPKFAAYILFRPGVCVNWHQSGRHCVEYLEMICYAANEQHWRWPAPPGLFQHP